MSIQQQAKPKAVIVDMDGTLVNVTDIRHHVRKHPKDFDSFHAASIDSPPIQQALDFCQRYHDQGYVILVVTARVHKWFYTSLFWLHENMAVPFEGPFMRQDNGLRPDVDVKREIFAGLVTQYDIRAACDDNPAIIALWQELGLDVEIVPGWEDSMTVGDKDGGLVK